jgi:hypothetical protein
LYVYERLPAEDAGGNCPWDRQNPGCPPHHSAQVGAGSEK